MGEELVQLVQYGTDVVGESAAKCVSGLAIEEVEESVHHDDENGAREWAPLYDP